MLKYYIDTPETNLILYINYTSTNKKTKTIPQNMQSNLYCLFIYVYVD